MREYTRAAFTQGTWSTSSKVSHRDAGDCVERRHQSRRYGETTSFKPPARPRTEMLGDVRWAGLAIYTRHRAAFLRPDLLRLRRGTPEAPGRDRSSRGQHVRLLLRPACLPFRPDVFLANRRGPQLAVYRGVRDGEPGPLRADRARGTPALRDRTRRGSGAGTRGGAGEHRLHGYTAGFRG